MLHSPIESAYQSALAQATYEWIQTSSSPTIHSSFGDITISDAAFDAGFANYSFGQCYTFPCPEGAPIPILQFDFSINGMDAFDISSQYLESLNPAYTPGSELIFDINIGIGSDGIANVGANVNNTQSNISVGNSIVFDSDNSSFGCFAAPCTGATGYWLGPAYVPEPNSLGLIAIAACALGWASRRKQFALREGAFSTTNYQIDPHNQTAVSERLH
jgi:hypothetical protein